MEFSGPKTLENRRKSPLFPLEYQALCRRPQPGQEFEPGRRNFFVDRRRVRGMATSAKKIGSPGGIF
jgi:hypothetical protein